MGVLLHHQVDGPADAPAVVLVGSLGSTLQMWEPNVPALSGPFRVIRIDQRGHGRSPAPPGPYTIAELADDVLTTLDALDVRQTAWCGLSMGAMIGMYLAATRPERITRLVLCATSAHFPDPSIWRRRIADVTRCGTAPLAARIVDRWFTPAWAAAHPDQVRRARRWVGRTPAAGYVGCCHAIETWDHVDRLADVAAPTLVLAGESDPVTPVEPHGRVLRDGIRGARLAVLPASHLLTIEAADEANRLIVEHLLPRVASTPGRGEDR